MITSVWVIACLYIRALSLRSLRRRSVLAAVSGISACAAIVAISHLLSPSTMAVGANLLLGLSATAVPGYWFRALLVPSTNRGVNTEHGASVTGSAWPAVPAVVAGRLMLDATGPLAPLSVGLITAVACTQNFHVTALATVGAVLNVCALSAITVAGEIRDSAQSRPSRNASSVTIAGATLCSVVAYGAVIVPRATHLTPHVVSWLAFGAIEVAVAATAIAVQAVTFVRMRVAPASSRRRRDRRLPGGIVGLVVLEMRMIAGDQRRRSLFLAPAIVAAVSLVVSAVAGTQPSGSTAAVVACAFLGTMFWKERADDDGMQSLLRQLPHGARRELSARIAAWLPAAIPVIVAVGARYGLSGATIATFTALQALAVGALLTVTSPKATSVRVFAWVSVVILIATVVESVVGAIAGLILGADTDFAALTGTAALITASLVWLLGRRSRVDVSLQSGHHDPYRLTLDTPLPLTSRDGQT